MRSPISPELLAAAKSGVVHYPFLKQLSQKISRPVAELLDDTALFVAEQYAHAALTFEESDVIINALWSASVSVDFWTENDQTIPAITREVFEAFDAGEYHHPDDPTHVDPEVKYTKPLISAFLANHKIALDGTFCHS